MTNDQKEVLKLYPLVVGQMAVWLVPFLGGIAGIVAVLLATVEPVGKAIGISAALLLVAVGVGGFMKQYLDRKRVINSVVLFKDWWSGVGAATIALCTHNDSFKNHVLLENIAMVWPSDDGKAENILSKHVFCGGVLDEVNNDGRPWGEFFQPITFVTLHGGKYITRGGRKFFGVADGQWIDVVCEGLSSKVFMKLVAHELQHRVLEQINPQWTADQQHEIMASK